MSTIPTLGFIGLGAMGGAMAGNVVAAGHSVIGFDLNSDSMQSALDAGIIAGETAADVVQRSEIVFTSLTNSEVFVKVAEDELLPNARAGQVFIDCGTVMPDDVRRLSTAMGNEGAHLLDVPVSGGVGGARSGQLRMFAGGDKAVFDRVLPILTVIGDPDRIIYCGGSGSGQVVKFVNQMSMGLSHAAMLESLALGTRAGIDLHVLSKALGGKTGWRSQFQHVAERIAAGEAEDVGVKFGQIHYFQAIAKQMGLSLPLSNALYMFCKDGERIVMEANRLSPSFWREIMKGG